MKLGNYNPVFTKSFVDRNRFNNETYFYDIFLELGFCVPNRLAVDNSSMCVTYTFIESKAEYDIDKVINVLAKIYENRNKILTGLNLREVKEKYDKDTENTLCNLGFTNNIVSEIIKIQNLYFQSSVFKDSKIDNWIFSKQKLYIIDFDYIVTSFFLQDLAQLFTSHLLKSKKESIPKDDIMEILSNFLTQTIYDLNNIYDFFILFISACLISNEKKLAYMKNYNISARQLSRLNGILTKHLKNSI